MNLPQKIALALPAIAICAGAFTEWPAQLRGNQALYVRHFRAPLYPPLARQANIQGDIITKLLILADGTVGSVSPVEGPPLLRDSAVQALKSWTFGGTQGAETVLTITVHFVLEGSEDEKARAYQISADLPSDLRIVCNPFPKRPFPTGTKY